MCDGIIKAAENADLFLCEAATNLDEQEKPEHLSPRLAGKVAKDSRVKHLILVHYSGKDEKEAMMRGVQEAGFVGKVSVASDLEQFIL